MPWYRSGTVNVTNNSTSVVGNGTNWTQAVEVGEAFYGPDSKVYEIANVVSDTQLTLATPYQGGTAAGQSYVIIPSQSYIRELAAEAAALVANYGATMSTAGAGRFADGTVTAPGIRFTADDDTGVRRTGSNALALVAGGADRVAVTTSGATVTGALTVSGKLTTAAPAAGGAGFNLPHGAAPTTPSNGDVWTTTSGVFARVNGATKTVAFTDSSITGDAATATKLKTPRTITIGNTGKSFDGSADVSWSLDEIGAPATDMADMSHTAIMQALGLASLANTSIDALRYGPYQQQGELFIRNRGVIAGCAITKSTTAARNLHIGAGQCFAGGNVFTVAQQDNAAGVPPNTGSTAVQVSAYLYPHTSGVYLLAVTAIGQNVPDNGIEIYRLTIPANNTNATDPYLASVTITDVRRIEPMYPDALDNPPSVSLVFARPMRGTDWRMDIDVVSSTGAPCRADQIVIANRATNGCTLWLGSAADDVRIRWQAVRLHD